MLRNIRAGAQQQTRAKLAQRQEWQRLKDAKPGEAYAWVQANVTDLASAKRVLGILAEVVVLLFRKARSER